MTEHTHPQGMAMAPHPQITDPPQHPKTFVTSLGPFQGMLKWAFRKGMVGLTFVFKGKKYKGATDQ